MKKTICIIDDDEIYQFTAKSVIESTGVAKAILSFHDGEEAIEYFQLHNTEKDLLPDLVLLDINMPYLDGWGFLEEYIKIVPIIEKKITIYIISSSVDEVDLQKAEQLSEVSGYVIKPITTEKFYTLLEDGILS